MNSEYITRRYQHGDEEMIVPLLKIAFGIWPFFSISCTPSEHWRWRYNDKPEHDCIAHVVTYEEKIVASMNSIMNKYWIYGKEYLWSYGTDGCVHPDHRKKGLHSNMVSSRMIDQKKEGADFAYIVTDNPIVVKSQSRKMAHPYQFPFNVSYLTRIENINEHIRAMGSTPYYIWWLKDNIDRVLSRISKSLGLNHIIDVKSFDQKVDRFLEKIVGKYDFILHRSRDYKNAQQDRGSSQVSKSLGLNHIIDVKSFDQKVDRFLEKIVGKYDFILHRSRDYLNWRYLDPRAGDYKVRVAEENGVIIGYCVVSINKIQNYHTGHIVDLLTLSGRLDVAETLLVSSLRFFEQEKVNRVIYQVIQDHPYEALSIRYGFKRGKKMPSIFYGFFGEQNLELETIPPQRVYFSMGDMTEM